MKLKLLIGPLIALIVLFFFDLNPGNPLVTRMAAIAIWMAIWWLTEAVHIAVTALLPIALLPLLGISDSKTTAIQYMDPIIFLFIGGFLLAFAIERWHLHKRIALKILIKVGTQPANILFGIMLTSYLISMWISNTATVMMLYSAVMALVVVIDQHYKQENHSDKIATAFLIGLAYSASIGGMATLVGTPTNMIFLREYQDKFPANNDINFFSWFTTAFPISFILLIVAFYVLKFLFLKQVEKIKIEKHYFTTEYKKLGTMGFEEKIIAIVFLITSILWFTRSDIDFGLFKMKGWSSLFPYKEYFHDSTVAIFMALLLFFIPSKKAKGEKLISWQDASKLPFDIILLFGGGFALAKGFDTSGLSNWISFKLNIASSVNIYLFILIMCAIITIISEFASNVACIQIMLPILFAIQKNMDVPVLMIIIPATLAASLGFMLPVATAPNTIVYSSQRIKVKDMMRVGFILNIIGILIILLHTLLKYE
ncbi:MAG: DASS family sodium-coupled anion symporter [Bacteroidia bacterium]